MNLIALNDNDVFKLILDMADYIGDDVDNPYNQFLDRLIDLYEKGH